MPFRTLDNSPAGTTGAADFLRYTPDLPEPLAVAILDKAIEREGRTTAVLIYGFEYTHPASNAVVLAPSGFVTDFASIPAAARMVISPFGRHAKAAVLHDWIYSVGEPGMKPFADRVFLDAMTELGVEAIRRDVMYEAVHLFGQAAFDHAEADWATSWADWKSGDLVKPPHERSAYFSATWPNPPRKAYDPRG